MEWDDDDLRCEKNWWLGMGKAGNIILIVFIIFVGCGCIGILVYELLSIRSRELEMSSRSAELSSTTEVWSTPRI